MRRACATASMARWSCGSWALPTRRGSGGRTSWPRPSRGSRHPRWRRPTSWARASHRRAAAVTQASAEAVLALARAQGLEHRVAQGRLLRGWALALQGDVSTGVPQMEQGWEAGQRTGLELCRSYVLALLAEAYGQAGHPEAGLTCLAEALTRVAATEERWWEAGVYRLEGGW